MRELFILYKNIDGTVHNHKIFVKNILSVQFSVPMGAASKVIGANSGILILIHLSACKQRCVNVPHWSIVHQFHQRGHSQKGITEFESASINARSMLGTSF